MGPTNSSTHIPSLVSIGTLKSFYKLQCLGIVDACEKELQIGQDHRMIKVPKQILSIQINNKRRHALKCKFYFPQRGKN
jgi:hypothetical protein